LDAVAQVDDQREAIAFLAAQTSERIDTHAAMVFLRGDRAYKLKRAVRFSYLDYSTVAAREASCRAELALNKRTAPDLYLAVRAITREPGGALVFDGGGAPVDWVVEMLRFDQDCLFDRLAGRGELSAELMERLSAAIAAFHEGAERTPGLGGRASLAVEIDGNEQNLALAPPGTFRDGLCASLVERWRAELARHAALLDRRDEQGHVRRCHGDLHLRNIFLWRGQPMLFDCIEFSEHLSCIDVLYDLAFLLMDLEHRKLGAFAGLVFNAYLDRSDEAEGIAALPLMMSLRAAIRAHTGVAAARSQSDAARRDAMMGEAAEYLELADRLLAAPAPQLIALGGLSGSGKSTLARALAPGRGAAPGARLLHTDAIRKRLYGVEKETRLSAAAYTEAAGKQVYRLQREAAATCLRAGYSAIVDGVFGRPEERAAIAAVARDCGAGFTGFWLSAPPETMRARIERRTDDMSDATVDVLAQQQRYEIGKMTWKTIDAGADAAAAAAQARVFLAGGLRPD
jgi:aminoglycoside phosphotransferase family enzyme/predicted kinase